MLQQQPTEPPLPALAPAKIGNVRFVSEPNRLILKPAQGVFAFSTIWNALFALLFTVSFINSLQNGRYGWAVFYGVFVVIDIALVVFRIVSRNERVTHDKNLNQLLGANDKPITALNTLKRVIVYKEGGVFRLAYIGEDEQRVVPSRTLTLFGKVEDARMAASQVSSFLALPTDIQV